MTNEERVEYVKRELDIQKQVQESQQQAQPPSPQEVP